MIKGFGGWQNRRLFLCQRYPGLRMKPGMGSQWQFRFEDLSTYPEPSRNACCRLMDGTRILTRSNADAIRHE